MIISLIGQGQLEHMATLAKTVPPGIFCEFGVYRGGSALHLMKVAKVQNRELHLFDTFEGIPERTEGIDKHSVGDFSDTLLDTVKSSLPEAVFHVGFIPETITDDLQNIAFIHIDCDQYATTKAILELCWSRMVPGGIIYFDDRTFVGVLMAIKETIDVPIAGSQYNSLHIIKPL